MVFALPPPATLATQARLLFLARRAWQWPHIVDVVPGMNNITLVFAALETDADAFVERLRRTWARTARDASGASGASGAAAKLRSRDPWARGRTVTVPVHYGGDDGPDLVHVAAHCGLSQEDVVALHCAGEYPVFFLGFQPGFAYLGGLDARLQTPRRERPRVSVPAGSVGIGGEQTGIYPVAAPGGWQVIGRTRQRMFDSQGTPPTLLMPGDRVRFQAVEL